MTNIAKHHTNTSTLAAPTPPDPVQWWTTPKLGADCESTGVRTQHDRIVSASLIPHPGGYSRRWEWLAAPGVDIPAEAVSKHGITTDYARMHGRPAGDVIAEICAVLEQHWTWGDASTAAVPLVGFNIHFDLSLLDAEARRHLGHELTIRGPVLDPWILDKQLDSHRQGKRNLGTVCEHYGVELTAEDAHTASGDTIAALQLLDRLTERERDLLSQYTLPDIHAAQHRWFQEQNAAKATELEQRAEELAERARQARMKAADSWPITGRY